MSEKVELLAPAGNVESLDAAVSQGADAVYLGIKDFNARLRCRNFSYREAEAAVRALHKLNRKAYITVNTVFTEREADRVYQLLKYIYQIGADAIIVQDFGVLFMARNYFPNLKVHSSTQMNVASARGCNFLSKQGVSRAVLARELSLEEIKKIRGGTNTELEVFVHGALCVSASGLCLFSSFLGGKSANRGMCTQACRRLYSAGTENENPGYYFSPKDLQLINELPELVRSGVNAFKIEGRMKSAEYVGNVVQAYRLALDAILENSNIDAALTRANDILKTDFAREKTTFHFWGLGTGDWGLGEPCFDNLNLKQDFADSSRLSTQSPKSQVPSPKSQRWGLEGGDYLDPAQSGGTGIKLGTVIKVKGAAERLALLPKGPLVPSAGDSVRIHKKDDSARLTHKISVVEETKEGEGFYIDVPPECGAGDSVYLIEVKSKSRRYKELLPRDLSAYRKAPGFDHAPSVLSAASIDKAPFPPGIYIAIQHIEDMYIVQSVKPKFVILNFDIKNAKQLLEKKNILPFKCEGIILNLPPFYNEALNDVYESHINMLLDAGFTNYIVNNIAHIQMLNSMKARPATAHSVKSKPEKGGINMIAGPYLYAFNSYSAAFLFNAGARVIVSPLENSRQNIEKTFEKKLRANIFVTIYAHPALFRVQDNLSRIYDFQKFYDVRSGEEFILSPGDETIAVPARPFSIAAKIPFLVKSGFSRFIIDFSPLALNKKTFKKIAAPLMEAGCQAITKAGGAPPPIPALAGASKFNWKDGFVENQASGITQA